MSALLRSHAPAPARVHRRLARIRAVRYALLVLTIGSVMVLAAIVASRSDAADALREVASLAVVAGTVSLLFTAAAFLATRRAALLLATLLIAATPFVALHLARDTGRLMAVATLDLMATATALVAWASTRRQGCAPASVPHGTMTAGVVLGSSVVPGALAVAIWTTLIDDGWPAMTACIGAIVGPALFAAAVTELVARTPMIPGRVARDAIADRGLLVADATIFTTVRSPTEQDPVRGWAKGERPVGAWRVAELCRRFEVDVPSIERLLSDAEMARLGRRTTHQADPGFMRDEPVDLDSVDAFAYANYARILADALGNAPSPFTIGLFGPWGVGKSSIARGVASQLPEDVVLVEVDVWRYEGDALRRELLRTLAEDLAGRGELDLTFDPKRDLRDLSVDIQRPRLTMIFPWARVVQLVAVSVALFAFSYAALHVGPVQDAFNNPDKKDAAAVSAATAILGLLVGLVRGVLEPVSVSQTVRRIEDPERFVEKLQQLLRAVRRRRLVLALDNLDRCSPERALQTLSTIKTLVEPTARRGQDHGLAEVAVLIAVDVEALRRHLLAQERHDSSDSHDASADVDEYLRKFFNVALRVQDLIPEDLREYASDALKDFGERNQISTGDFDRLVALVHSALRQNPRRIKQFINNLELRLRLMRDREPGTAHGRVLIGEPLSEQIAVVAKVAVLEEEWPAHYRLLVDRPGRLRQWTRAALDGDEPSWRSEAWREESDELRKEWPRLSEFLVATSDVDSPQLRAFVHLRLSNLERETPGLGEFREAITAGALRDASAVLNEHPEMLDDYAQDLPQFLSRELNAGAFVIARMIVQIAFGAPQFAKLPGTRFDALARVIVGNRIFMDDQLLDLPEQTLVQGFRRLSSETRSALVERMASSLRRAPSTEQRTTVAHVLAAFADDLAPEMHREIEYQLGEMPLNEEFGVLDAFVRGGRAELVPGVALDVATNRIGAQPALLGVPVEADQLMRVTRAALQNARVPDRHDRLAGMLAQNVGVLDTANALTLLAAADLARAETVDRFLEQLAGQVPTLQPETLRLVLSYCSSRRIATPAIEELFASVASAKPDVLLNWVEDSKEKDALSPDARYALADALTTTGTDDAVQVRRIVETLVALDRADARSRVLAFASGLLAERRFPAAREALTLLPPGARSDLEGFGERLRVLVGSLSVDDRIEALMCLTSLDKLSLEAAIGPLLPSIGSDLELTLPDATVERLLDVVVPTLPSTATEAVLTPIVNRLETRTLPVVQKIASLAALLSEAPQIVISYKLAERFVVAPEDRGTLIPLLESLPIPLRGQAADHLMAHAPADPVVQQMARRLRPG